MSEHEVKIDVATSGFFVPRTRRGMRPPRPSSPGDVAPPSGPREPSSLEPSTAELYGQHWAHVLRLLLGCGIPAQDAEDVAQAVWLNVHRRRDSYDVQIHKTPRAWITGFVVRCAANHRRTQRRRALVPMEEPGELLAALGLDPEQAALLSDLHRLIPNEDQRVALILQIQHGLTIAEIAAAQEVTESAVEWRLHMARKKVQDGDDETKAGAFLGFGSLEALAEALKPKPIADEVGRRMWERIAERIRQEDASPNDPERAPSEPPPSSFPPAAAVPAPASATASASISLGAAKLAGVLLLAFLSGAGTGTGCVGAWGAREHVRPAMDAARVATALRSTPEAPSTVPSSTCAVSSTPSTGPGAVWTSPRAIPSTSAAPSVPTGAAAVNEDDSQRLLARMRAAVLAREFATVIALANEHARRFGTMHLREREALRIKALRQAGQTKDAEDRARAVIVTHPEHRGAMEHAAGQALP